MGTVVVVMGTVGGVVVMGTVVVVVVVMGTIGGVVVMGTVLGNGSRGDGSR